MSHFGEVAIQAIILSTDHGEEPREAWNRAVEQYYPGSPPMQNKNCPRATFLGIAEEGLIKGISAGDYVNSPMNKQHGLDAIELLRSDDSMSELRPSALWKLLPGVELHDEANATHYKTYNQEMDVVLALWNAGLIEDEGKSL